MKSNLADSDEYGRKCTKCETYKLWNLFSKKQCGYKNKNSVCKECVKKIKNEKKLLKIKIPKLIIDNNGRQCSKCKVYKKWDKFNNHKHTKTKKYYSCIDCGKEACRKWKRENIEKRLEYKKRIKEKLQNDPEFSKKYKEISKKSYNKNREKRLKTFSEYSKRKKRWLLEDRKIYAREYSKKRTAKDPQFKLTNNIRASVRYCLKLKGVIKEWNTFSEYLKFSIEELMQHLEKQFLDGMTWENYGEWHVDHIYPASLFNYKTHEDLDFKKCWDIENLRPLWKQENWDKHDKLTPEAIEKKKYLDLKYSER